MAAPARRFKLSRVLIIGAGLLVAVNLLVFAGLGHNDDSKPQLPTEIQQLFPNPQEVIRPQETVGADLRDDLQGQLYINNVAVPADQIVGDPSLGIYTFRPGCQTSNRSQAQSACEFREFDPGTYSARIDFWPRDESLQDATDQHELGSYGWSFKVG
jgi:hypothetical protein